MLPDANAIKDITAIGYQLHSVSICNLEVSVAGRAVGHRLGFKVNLVAQTAVFGSADCVSVDTNREKVPRVVLQDGCEGWRRTHLVVKGREDLLVDIGYLDSEVKLVGASDSLINKEGKGIGVDRGSRRG